VYRLSSIRAGLEVVLWWTQQQLFNPVAPGAVTERERRLLLLLDLLPLLYFLLLLCVGSSLCVHVFITRVCVLRWRHCHVERG
jgi:hypothetical protein